ncbi:MAG: CoA transferase [Acidimicrobiia bacterium]
MLSPYRVLDVTDERGQLAGYLLGVLGAEVIAVEPPGGAPSRRLAPLGPDGVSLAHRAYNRGKRSVALDLGDERDRSRFDALAAGSDVLLCSGSPAELRAGGLDPDELLARHPHLVVTAISPFGLSGPKADWAATDLTVWAAGGPLSLSGDPGRAPVQCSVPQAYLHGATHAAGGALLALLERARSGRGQLVDVSTQIATMVATQSAALCASARASLVSRSGGGIKGGDIFLRFVYPAADGHVSFTHVFGAAVGPATARFMAYLCEHGACDEATRDKDWVTYAMDLSAGRESMEEFERIKASIAAFTAGRTKAELFAAAQEHRLLLAPVATTVDVLESEQFAARDHWDRIDGARYPGPFARLTGTPLVRPGPAPACDADAALAEEAAAGAPARRPAMAMADPAAGIAGDPRPLAGLKVVDFMWAVAGPTLSRALADAGASVVRIESMTRIDAARAFLPFFDDEVGSERSALFNNLAAGKRSLTLNLSLPAARELALELCAQADVVCESFSPKAMRQFGLDYERIRARNPGVVMLSSCLFGQSGPLSMFAGYGNLAAAMTGFYNLTGWPDGDPIGPFGAYTDYTAPAMSLAVLLAAIDHRRRTGEGQYIDFSQAEAALHHLAPALLDREYNDVVVGRTGNVHADLCPHGVFRCAGEDRWVAIVAQHDRAWASLAPLLGRSEWAGLDVATRRARRAEIEAAIEAWTSVRTAADVEACCQSIGVAAHQVQNAPELEADPQLVHLGHFRTVPHALHGDTVVEGPRVALSRTPIGPERGGPLLGEHTFEVLTEWLGYDAERIAELAAAELFD